MLLFLTALHPQAVKHASAIQGKLGEAGSRVRGTLTSSMFGNLTGTYPGIQAASNEPERQLKATQFGHADCQSKVGFRSGGPGQPVRRECSNFQ